MIRPSLSQEITVWGTPSGGIQRSSVCESISTFLEYGLCSKYFFKSGKKHEKKIQFHIHIHITQCSQYEVFRGWDDRGNEGSSVLLATKISFDLSSKNCCCLHIIMRSNTLLPDDRDYYEGYRHQLPPSPSPFMRSFPPSSTLDLLFFLHTHRLTSTH